MVQTKSNEGADSAAKASAPAMAAKIAGSMDEKSDYDRRLSDKILSAFNHAYASGAHKVAGRLKTVLADVELTERRKYDRRSASAICQAELWVAFIESRNGYNDLMASSKASPAKVEAALELMKEAYRVWANT